MSALSGLVRKELRRYSSALGAALASFETRNSVQTIDEFASILAEIHTLFEDDFLDRLEPSGWIQPLFELSLVPQSVSLMVFILRTYQDAKDAGLLVRPKPGSEPDSPEGCLNNRHRPDVLVQLVAMEAGQAAVPIQWAAQAIQHEAARHQPMSQRLGPQLFEQLTVDAALEAMAAAACLVLDELWEFAAAGPTPATAGKPVGVSVTANVTTNNSVSIDGAMAIVQATSRRWKSTGSAGGSANASASAGGSFFRRGAAAAADAQGAMPSTAISAAVAGARLLSVVANYVSAILTAVQEQYSATTPRGSDPAEVAAAAAAAAAAVPAARRLLMALGTSGVLRALCAAVLAAPPCPPAAADAVTVDDYTNALSEVQLTLFMIMWDLSALVAAPYGTVASGLLAAPEVVQLRRMALEQVAASAAIAADAAAPENPFGPGLGRGAAGGTSGGSNTSGGASAGGSDGGGTPGAAAAPECWPLLRCQAVRRIYAARGLQFADLVHVLVDAAVGAVLVPHDLGAGGASTAAAAAQQLFPSLPEAAELSCQVCRALWLHSERLAKKLAKAALAAAGKEGRGASAGGPGSGTKSGLPSYGYGRDHVPSRQQQRQLQQQREQLADDGASVQAAIRVRWAAASREEALACADTVAAMRQWVAQMAAPQPSTREASPDGDKEDGAAAAAGGIAPSLVAMTLADSPVPQSHSAAQRQGRRSRDLSARSPRGPPPPVVASAGTSPPDPAPANSPPTNATARVTVDSCPDAPAADSPGLGSVPLAGSPQVGMPSPSAGPSPTILPHPSSPTNPPLPSPASTQEPQLEPQPAQSPTISPRSPRTQAGEGPCQQSVEQARPAGGRRRLKLLPPSIRSSIGKLKRWVATRSP